MEDHRGPRREGVLVYLCLAFWYVSFKSVVMSGLRLSPLMKQGYILIYSYINEARDTS